MKVISLLQPWATLVVIGAKKIETRSWNTEYRGPILIHASKRKTKEGRQLAEIANNFNVKKPAFDDLPFGAIIGKVNLINTFSTDVSLFAQVLDYKDRTWELTDKEITFGDFTESRYGWLLSDPVQFKKQIPAKGSLSLWNYKERICLQCGCTEDNACVSKEFGPCWWIDDETDICSHCLEGVKDII